MCFFWSEPGRRAHAHICEADAAVDAGVMDEAAVQLAAGSFAGAVPSQVQAWAQ